MSSKPTEKPTSSCITSCWRAMFKPKRIATLPVITTTPVFTTVLPVIVISEVDDNKTRSEIEQASLETERAIAKAKVAEANRIWNSQPSKAAKASNHSKPSKAAVHPVNFQELQHKLHHAAKVDQQLHASYHRPHSNQGFALTKESHIPPKPQRPRRTASRVYRFSENAVEPYIQEAHQIHNSNGRIAHNCNWDKKYVGDNHPSSEMCSQYNFRLSHNDHSKQERPALYVRTTWPR